MGRIKIEIDNTKRTSRYFLFFLCFYGVQLVLTFFIDFFPPWPDLLAAVLLLCLVYILHTRVGFRRTVPLFMGLGFLLHIAGLYQVIPYNPGYIGTLYGAPQLFFHYDLIVHSVGIFFFSLVICSMTYPYFRKGFKSKLFIFVLILFIMLGIGAFNEILEYVGFDVLGQGEGFLEFGEGDSAPGSGPWENASLDLLANLLGGIVSIGSFLTVKRRQEQLGS